LLKMQPLECRFRLGRAFGESALLLLWVFVALLWSTQQALPGVVAPPARVALAIAGAGTCLLVGALIGRWRARLRVDENGMEFRGSPGYVSTRLEWSEVDELFLLDDTQFEVRGAGRVIRFAGPYDDLYSARQACLPRLQGIRDALQAQALRDGKVTFRMPAGRWRAHLAYFAAVLVLSGVTWACLATLLDRKFRTGLPFVFLFFGGSWLWGMRRRASGLGTRVTLEREGFGVWRLDGRDMVPWEELDRAEWNDQNGINLVLRSRRTIVLPPTLGNIGLLEEFLHEGRRAVDSEARGQAEGRTMMQSP
jgi:hypothetical protein